MITETVIQSVYKQHAGKVSLANVRSILETFETAQVTPVTNALELRYGEVVFVKNDYTGGEEEFDTLDSAIRYITEFAYDRSWDVSDIESNFEVTVGRKINITASQVTTVTFS